MTHPDRASEPAQQIVPVRTVSEDVVPARSGVVAWWSGVKREGEWIVPRAFRGFAFMGHVEIDLTTARMGRGVTEMELNCVMGAIDVIIPPDVRVLCDGGALAGAFNVERVGNTTPPADAPVIRISGNAYFGAVNIKIVDPNAPGWAEKLKAKIAFLKGDG